MTKFRKSLLIFGLLALIVLAALGTFVALTVIGSIKSEPIGLEFTVEDAEQEYNGEALKATSYFLSDGRLVEGHKPVVTFTGEQTDVGTGSSGLEVKIVDENGYDVTDEYAIKVNGGKLTVSRYEISIKLNDKDVVYGGDTFSITQDDYDVVGGVLPQGHRVFLNIKDDWLSNINNWKNGTKALTAKDVEIMIFDKNGRNVSHNYSASLSGNVNLVKRPITLSPLSAEKTYDGRELVCSQYSISKGSLAVSHYLEPIFKGLNGELASVKNANEDSPLTVIADAQIYDADGNNVTQFYDITSDRATLTVRRANLTIVAKSASQEYNGKDLTLAEDNEAKSCTGLAAGESVNVTYSGSVSGIGTAENKIESFTVSGGNDNYKVTLQSGVLEVKKANLTVTLKDSVKEYDGLPFYMKGATSAEATSGDISEFYEVTLPAGFSVSVCEMDGILEEAELCNTTYNIKTFKISDVGGEDVTSCFNVTSKAAVCRINRCAVNLTQTGEVAKKYDGNFEFSSGIDFADDKLVSGHTFKSVTVASFTPALGLTQNVGVVSFTLVDSLGRDAIGYYDIKNLNTFTADVTIIPQELEISTKDYDKEYDGIAVGGDLTYGLLAPTDRLVVTKPVSEVDYTEEKDNKPEFEIYNNKNEIVTGFYALTETYGKIRISKKSLLVSLEYCEIEYSGENLTAENATLVNNLRCDALNPDNFALTLPADTKSIGEKTVQIGWKNTENKANDNYSLSYGNLKFDIVKRKLTSTINTSNAQKYYDAQPLIMSDMKPNLIDLSGLNGVVTDLSGFTCVSSNILGEVNAYNYSATLVYESATDKITVTGYYTIKQSTVQITSQKTHAKNYDGTPYTFNTDDLVVKISGTDTVLSAIKVRNYSTEKDVTDVKFDGDNVVGQSVTINSADLINATTGELIGSNNVNVISSDIAVTINRQRLTFNINTTNMNQGTYNPSDTDVLTAQGLGNGNTIVYSENAYVIAGTNGYAMFNLYDSDVLNFIIKDVSNNDVTNFYIIEQTAIRVPY